MLQRLEAGNLHESTKNYINHNTCMLITYIGVAMHVYIYREASNQRDMAGFYADLPT